jgi:hypothetical protein
MEKLRISKYKQEKRRHMEKKPYKTLFECYRIQLNLNVLE